MRIFSVETLGACLSLFRHLRANFVQPSNAYILKVPIKYPRDISGTGFNGKFEAHFLMGFESDEYFRSADSTSFINAILVQYLDATYDCEWFFSERLSASRRNWPDVHFDMRAGIRQIARHADFPEEGIVHPQAVPPIGD